MSIRHDLPNESQYNIPPQSPNFTREDMDSRLADSEWGTADGDVTPALETIQHEFNVDDLNERKSRKGLLVGLGSAAAGVALVGGIVGAKILGSNHDNDPTKAKARPVAAAPAVPGHETAPAATPETSRFEPLPPLEINSKVYDGPDKDAKIEAASKAFEIPADASPKEAANLLVAHLNTYINWTSYEPSDPKLAETYDNFKINETENDGDPDYDGYSSNAGVFGEGVVPAAKKGLIGEWMGGDGTGDPSEQFDKWTNLARSVGSHAGTAQANHLPPYSLNFKVDTSKAGGYATYPLPGGEGKTMVSVFLETEEKGLDGLSNLSTADGSTIGSLKQSSDLHIVFQKKENGTQQIVSAVSEDAPTD